LSNLHLAQHHAGTASTSLEEHPHGTIANIDAVINLQLAMGAAGRHNA